MRNLIFNDVFKMSKILGMLKIKINAEGKTQQQLGGEMILAIMENAHLAQDEINDFMGGLTDMTGDEFGSLRIDEAYKYFTEFKELKGIDGFFKLAGQLKK